MPQKRHSNFKNLHTVTPSLFISLQYLTSRPRIVHCKFSYIAWFLSPYIQILFQCYKHQRTVKGLIESKSCASWRRPVGAPRGLDYRESYSSTQTPPFLLLPSCSYSHPKRSQQGASDGYQIDHITLNQPGWPSSDTPKSGGRNGGYPHLHRSP